MRRPLRVTLWANAPLLLLLGVPDPAPALDRQWCLPTPQGSTLHAVAFQDALHGCAVGARGTTLTTEDGGSTWQDRTAFETFAATLHDVLALPSGEYLAVGDSPFVFRSIDGGASWMPVANPAAHVLHEVRFTGASTLSAVGDAGQALRSSDGGATWEARPEIGSFPVYDQFWKSAGEGFVLGTSECRRTTDGGGSWAAVAGVSGTFFFSGDVFFTDAQNGWISVDFTTWRTTNGGASWFQKHGPFGQSPIYQQEGIYFDAAHRIVFTGAEGAEIWETFDDGLHWVRHYQNQGTEGFRDAVRLPDDTLIAVGSGGLCLSSTGGAVWSPRTLRPADLFIPLQAFAIAPGGRAFAGGWANALLTSNDDADSWMIASDNPDLDILSDIDFASAQAGLIGGSIQPATQSVVARTSDGGVSWEQRTVVAPYAGSTIDVDLLPSGVAWAALWGGDNLNSVYRSVDFGQTWTARSAGIPSNVRLNCLHAVDDAVAFAAGGNFSDPRLYFTSNGGIQWATLPDAGVGAAAIRAMHWFDEQQGLLANDAGIYRTTNRGATWSARASGFFTCVAFDGTTGIAGGPLDPEVLLSEDGGQSWTTFDTGLERGPERVVVDGERFFLVGAETSVLRLVEVSTTVEATPRVEPVRLELSLLGEHPVRGRLLLELLRAEERTEGGPIADRHPRVSLHDASGRELSRLRETSATPGRWRFAAEGSSLDVPTGVYWVRAELGSAQASCRVLVLR